MHVQLNFFLCRLCASCYCFPCVSTCWILNEISLICINFSLQDQISYRPAPTERTPILARPQTARAHSTHGQPISLIDALYIPGVMEFSLCLFFTKLVSYTFMYWLPLYIQSSSKFSALKMSGQIITSIIFLCRHTGTYILCRSLNALRCGRHLGRHCRWLSIRSDRDVSNCLHCYVVLCLTHCKFWKLFVNSVQQYLLSQCSFFSC